MKSRLKKVALMPTQMFQSQLDQISDKGRDVLKAIEEYKFFVEQTSRVMKNDQALTEVIIGKKKNLEEASTKIYDVVFDIENLDIAALYEKQQQEIENRENQTPAAPESTEVPEGPTLPDSPQPEQPAEENKPEPPSDPEPPVDTQPEEKEETAPKPEPKTPDSPKSRLKTKPDSDSKDDKKKDPKKDKDNGDEKDSKEDSKEKTDDKEDKK